MKELYIFDFDGTLVNTFYDSILAYNRALKKHNLPEYEYEDLSQVDYKDFINSITHDEDVLSTYQEEYENGIKEYTKAYPHIIETLEKLQNDNKILAICSNRIQYQLEEYAKSIFPTINFKYIIGYEFGHNAKPDPEMINKILDNERFEKNEIIYIGDRTTDIETAKNVDIDVVIVKWGQGDDAAFNDEYPIKIINSANQLLNI